ncbi:UNVERIFIED_CONTAM: ABC-type Fe3+-siderophore transport system permease subunit [Paenibacillus sp. PvR008]
MIYIFSYSRTSGLDPIRLVLVGVGFSLALSGIMIVIISSAEREGRFYREMDCGQYMGHRLAVHLGAASLADPAYTVYLVKVSAAQSSCFERTISDWRRSEA